jgi:hypothetical protein
MAQLYDELLELYCRHDQRVLESLAGDVNREGFAEYVDENGDAGVELADAIIRIAQPKTVRDAMALPVDTLRTQGLAYLIERDASDHYDQVEGFLDIVFEDQVEAAITPAQHGFDGLELCEWIDQTFPVPA